MALFGQKEQPAPSQPPVDIVKRMKEQGFSNNQIVQYLQREGFKSHNIFDALNQAEMQSGAPLPAQEGMIAPEPAPSAPQQDAYPAYGYYPPQENTEEMVESIVEEKWKELMKTVSKIIEWKELTEKRLDKFEHGLDAVKEQLEGLQKAMMGKIGEYESSISNVGSDVKALEKVFQKILPTLSENVSELSRLTSDLKKKR